MDVFLFVVIAVVSFMVSEIAIEWNDERLKKKRGGHRE